MAAKIPNTSTYMVLMEDRLNGSILDIEKRLGNKMDFYQHDAIFKMSTVEEHLRERTEDLFETYGCHILVNIWAVGVILGVIVWLK